MRTGYTLTRHFDLEPRQHELLGVDLGEGVPRRTLILGIVSVGVWTGTMLLLLGVPSPQSLSVYLLPPGLVTVLGTQRSRRVDRRRNITCWSLALRYLVVGHRPVVLGGRRAARRGELLSWRARCAVRVERLAALAPSATWVERWRAAEAEPEPTAGPSWAWSHKARLVGPDRMDRARRRAARRERTKTS